VSTSSYLYDACVLYSAPLRDLLMELALADLYMARWTKQIEEEWIRAILNTRPDLSREHLERTRDKMNRAVPGALIEGYEHLIPSLELPDPDDRHVLAAAIHAEAVAIITLNLRDFPPLMLAPYGIRAIHPNEFVEELISFDPQAVLAAAQRQRASLKRPPKTAEEFLATPAFQDLPTFLVFLRAHVAEL